MVGTLWFAALTMALLQESNELRDPSFSYQINTAHYQNFQVKQVLKLRWYTGGWNVWGEWFLAGTQGNHQNFDPSLLTNKLWLVFMGMKQKKIFFLKKKFKMADWKKGHFSKSPILDIFLWKFNGLVLGLVGLNDAKGINLAQPIWLWGCPT